jgi:endonuclease-3
MTAIPRKAAKAAAAKKIIALLRRYYPDATCALHHQNPLQLLIATILSAQCTDERVNLVTPALFARFQSAADFAAADRGELEQLIRSTGFYKNKARNIKGCCQQLVERHEGEVPQDLDALVALPGVGRKTANVVLGVAFGKAEGVVVDTHVSRLAKRMGFTRAENPVVIERDLMALVKPADWIDFSHLLITHGRRVCKARKPQCPTCFLEAICEKKIKR